MRQPPVESEKILKTKRKIIDFFLAIDKEKFSNRYDINVPGAVDIRSKKSNIKSRVKKEMKCLN